MTITAAVDGSSLGNPGPAGWAWVVDDSCWDAGGWPEGTNNLGELTAVLELLRATEAAGLAHEPLHVLADSQYAINVVSKWRLGWKKRGWTKADKKPIKNLGLIQEIDRAIEGRRVTFEWVKGHAGHPMNEAADDRARGCAEAYRDGRVPSGGPGFGRVGGGGGAGEGTASAEARAGEGSRALADSPDSSAMEGPMNEAAERVHASLSVRADAEREGAQGAQEGPDLVASEKEMILAWAGGDAEALARIEAPGAVRIWPDGRSTPGMAGPAPTGLKVGRIEAVRAGADAWLVRYRIRWQAGESLETSIWVAADAEDDRADGLSQSPGVRILHHQSTLLPGA
ncbi:ribonuclease HI [Actinomyces sp. B33]|uniref:ribonuclease H family protein n=1 Tax=Actinomyces sp. B33 TaxID=2942131 RepID=UPI0023427279|nr:ribonuclease H [Actinomyces sp. B33]MDC4233980.1 ribonuclease HI [Actinomyces sp. B33]